jgi:hypothetical protein
VSLPPPRVERGPEPLVVAASGAFEAAAEACARRIGGRRLQRAAWEAATPPAVVIWWDEQGPALRGPPAGARARRPPAPVGPRPGHEPLLRALGRPIAGARVIDATAGWGVDAGVMAAAGAHVLMLERSPAMALVLQAALTRWRAAGVAAAERLELLAGDARELLGHVGPADVVYLDPLYADRGGRRTSAAELRWLRAVAAWSSGEAEDDGAALLEAARAAANRRVVVKRARNDPPLAGVAPSGSIGGHTTRYDLYAGSGAGARG